MNKPDTVPAIRGGLLGGRPVDVRRLAVRAELAPFIRNAWFVDWDVPDDGHRLQAVLAPPAVNVSVQPGEDAVTGVQIRADERVLVGRSWVRGVLFREAGFGAVVGATLHAWVDRREPLANHFGPVDALRRELSGAADPVALEVLEDWLARHIRDEQPARREAAQALVDTLRDDREIRTVADLVAVSGVSERTLQRTLRAWVGLGPKALIRRYRLHEAAHLLTTDPNLDLADLAYTLGYADQAHFSRDFARVVGRPPGRYGKSVRDERDG